MTGIASWKSRAERKSDSAYTNRQTQAEHENVPGALKEIEALAREVSGTVHRNSP